MLATLGYAPRRASRAWSLTARILVLSAVVASGRLGWNMYQHPGTVLPMREPRDQVADAPGPGPRATSVTGSSAGSEDRAIANQTDVPERVAGLRADGGPGASDLANAGRPVGLPSPSPAAVAGLVRLPDAATTGASIRAAAPARRPPPAIVPPEAAASASRQPGDLDLALYYHRAGDFENALQSYRALLRSNELDAQAHNNLGLLYQERNLLDESARELQRALVIEPRNAGTHNNYGVTLLKQGRLDEALGEFQTASGLAPRSVEALVNMALARRDAGQPAVAMETLVRALTLDPRNPAAHYNLAQLYDQADEAPAAVEHYRKFLETAGAEYASRVGAVRNRIDALTRHSN